jgi:hypothetical protein
MYTAQVFGIYEPCPAANRSKAAVWQSASARAAAGKYKPFLEHLSNLTGDNETMTIERATRYYDIAYVEVVSARAQIHKMIR